MSLISNEFYSQSWLLPEIPARITIKVTEMKKAKNLAHLNETFRLWALMKGRSQGGRIFQQKPSTDQTP